MIEMMKEIQRIGDAIGLEGKFCVNWGTDDIIDLFKEMDGQLNPLPETEEVEVKVWTCTSCLMSQGKPGECCGLMQGNIVTITRPKKKLVTRREEMATDKVTHRTLRHYPTTARYYAEWQEEQ